MTLDQPRGRGLAQTLQQLDRRQQASRPIGFLAAVVKKFGDDEAGQLAALIAYYAFVSLFPLLLVFVTVLGFVLDGDPDAQQRILDGALGQIPLIGDQLQLHSLSGSGVALAVGIIGALLAGMGITNATQSALDRMWNVPRKERRGFVHARLRGLAMLAILGTLLIVSTAAGGLVGSGSRPAVTVVGGVLVAFAFNLALFLTAFKLLTAAQVSWRDVLPGALVATVFWQLLQHLGGYYLSHVLQRTEPLYGVFALVLGLLAWLYLGAQLTIFAAEINVVRGQRLWPRSFVTSPPLEADRRAAARFASAEQRLDPEHVPTGPGEPG